MTVEELIEELKQLPQNYTIEVNRPSIDPYFYEEHGYLEYRLGPPDILVNKNTQKIVLE